MRIVDYIGDNLDIFRGFIKAGIICPSQYNYFRIYNFYKSTDNIPSKMDRYNFTAETCGVKVTTVRNAIKAMESKLPSGTKK